jgi:primary-amine oxidase
VAETGSADGSYEARSPLALPSGSRGGRTAEYVAEKARIDGPALVVWNTVGFTHEPTIEEYPVMPRETVGFSLPPDGLSDSNPALDLP